MKRIAITLLTLGASLCALLAIGHLACLLFLREAFDWFQIGEWYDAMAQYYRYLPHLTAVIVALLLGMCATCGFRAARPSESSSPEPQPAFLRLSLLTIGCVFMMRGVMEMQQIASERNWAQLLTMLLSITIGLCYLWGNNIINRNPH